MVTSPVFALDWLRAQQCDGHLTAANCYDALPRFQLFLATLLQLFSIHKGPCHHEMSYMAVFSTSEEAQLGGTEPAAFMALHRADHLPRATCKWMLSCASASWPPLDRVHARSSVMDAAVGQSSHMLFAGSSLLLSALSVTLNYESGPCQWWA